MGKSFFQFVMGTVVLVAIIAVPLGGTAFAYGGGGSSDAVDPAVSTGGTGVVPGFEEENIDTGVAGGPATLDPPEEESTLENTWGKHHKTKPPHWTQKQWRDYTSKRQSIFRHQKNQAVEEEKSADRKLTIAKGTGMVASAAGAVVGAVAAPAVAPTIVIISVAGDGLAATAGSLADGKSVKESVKDGVKKSVSSAILSKVGSGKTNAVIGFVGGQAYDNASPQSNKSQQHMYWHNQAPEHHDSFGRVQKY